MKKDRKDEEIVLIRSGDQSIYASVKNGETILLGDPATFVDSFITKEEEQMKIEDEIDDILYSKPIALVKKIERKIKKK